MQLAQDARLTLTALQSGMKSQASQGLILQGHAQALERQPMIDVSAYPSLTPVGDSLTNVLGAAKASGTRYLNEIQPNTLKLLVNVAAYANFVGVMDTYVRPGMSQADITRTLTMLGQYAEKYEDEAKSTAKVFCDYRQTLSGQASGFAEIEATLSSLANANTGLLKDFDSQMRSIDSLISASIAGTVLGVLGIIGGAVVTAIGAIAGFVTAGTSTPLVLVGATIVIAGVGSLAAGATGLILLTNQKHDLLRQSEQLKAELKFAATAKNTILSLADQTATAAVAAQQVQNSWTSLGAQLAELASFIETGKLDPDSADLFFQMIAPLGRDLKGGVKTIQDQFAGVKIAGSETAELVQVLNGLAAGKIAA